MTSIDRLLTWLSERCEATPIADLIFGPRYGDEMFTFYRMGLAIGMTCALAVWVYMDLWKPKGKIKRKASR